MRYGFAPPTERAQPERRRTSAGLAPHELSVETLGGQVGAAAFVLYCLAAVPLVRRFGAWKGSAGAVLVWGAGAAVGYAAVLA